MSKKKPELRELDIDTGVSRRVRKRELSPKIRKLIKRQKRDGITLSVDWREPRHPLQVTAIHWRPGKRNALAKAIIKDCRGPQPLPLELDGHHYLITPEVSDAQPHTQAEA